MPSCLQGASLECPLKVRVTFWCRPMCQSHPWSNSSRVGTAKSSIKGECSRTEPLNVYREMAVNPTQLYTLSHSHSGGLLNLRADSRDWLKKNWHYSRLMLQYNAGRQPLQCVLAPSTDRPEIYWHLTLADLHVCRQSQLIIYIYYIGWFMQSAVRALQNQLKSQEEAW